MKWTQYPKMISESILTIVCCWAYRATYYQAVIGPPTNIQSCKLHARDVHSLAWGESIGDLTSTIGMAKLVFTSGE